MPVYVSYSVTTEANVTMTYTCAACHHTAGMRIRGTGVASYGFLRAPSEAGEVAKKDALENARNVGELARCPRCRHRDLSRWRSRWIRAGLWPLLAFPAVWMFGVLAGLSWTNVVDHTLAIVKMGGFLALIPEAWIALYFLAELKQASEIQFISTSQRKRRAPETRNPASAERMQFAGRTCPVCQKKIVWGDDGAPCDECPVACHVDCVHAHHAQAHGHALIECAPSTLGTEEADLACHQEEAERQAARRRTSTRKQTPGRG
jgi:hypothetical protein